MSLTKKLQSVPDLSKDQIKLITRSMPRELEQLKAVFADEVLSDDVYDAVLVVTRSHKRDQAKSNECLSYIKAFSNGGLCGMERLNEVQQNIFKHFKMEKEKWEILTAANVGLDFQSGRLYLRGD
jgi:hypothetical protein